MTAESATWKLNNKVGTQFPGSQWRRGKVHITGSRLEQQMHGIRRSSRVTRVCNTHHTSIKGDGSDNLLSIHARNTN